jgi:hypothetical protein
MNISTMSQKVNINIYNEPKFNYTILFLKFLLGYVI